MAPCVESLEGRLLMAAQPAQVTISEGLSSGSPTLLILGTNGSDIININDNGPGNAGNVTVTLGNGSHYTTQSAVAEVEVVSRGGHDQISYTLSGPLMTERTVLINLGSGTDQFTANINGAVENQAGLDLEAYAGSGTDTMTINQTGPILQGTFIPFLAGGRGKATMTYNGTGPISAGAMINPAFDAGSGNNTMVSRYSGTIDGHYAYNMTVKGGGGNNTIIDNIHVGPGSTGTVGTSPTVPALVKAGRGKTKIHYAVTVDPTATGAQVYAAVTGTRGRDQVERTANVQELSSGANDAIVSS
jgi:hypothetical protein